MVVGEIPENVDLVVVGGGPGGYAAALRAAQLGREVVLIERGGSAALGGTCLHVGCIPSKALIELAHVRKAAAEMAERGLTFSEPELNLAQFRTDTEGRIRRLSDGVGSLLARGKVRVIEGEARFSSPTRIAVARADAPPIFLQFADAVIASGSRPVDLAVLPHDGQRILNSTDVLALTEHPESMAIVGGGYIGLEMASALHALGVQITVLELAEQILPGVDSAISSILARSLSRRGIKLITGAEVTGDDGEHLRYRRGEDEESLRVDAVAVATGRRPNTDALGLREAGIEVEPSGLVAVGADRRLTEHIAAIGDITGAPALAHKAMAEGHVAADALSGKKAVFDPAAIPAVVYTDPEVALVGESERSAALSGRPVNVSAAPMAAVSRSVIHGSTEGIARIISDRETDQVLGVQLIGANVSELIAEAVVAIEMGAVVEDLAASIHPHPSMSEALGEVALLAHGTPLHLAG